MNSPTLDTFRDLFSAYGSPVIVFNKSHSGSRMLAELLSSAGIFMGANLNESWDSLDLFELVDYLVTNYYPDFFPLWDGSRLPDLKLAALLEGVFTRHLAGVRPGVPWGWKLCETVYILPVLDYIFPGARYVHLIRDGRDVAFCNHRGPDREFWRKVYFNTGRIRTFNGLRFTPMAYRRHSYIFNALHWVNSVSMGRAFGAMLRERYVEVRYENLCMNFAASAAHLLESLQIPCTEESLANFKTGVYGSSIGKYKSRSRSALAQVLRIEKPLLLALGYLEQDLEPASNVIWRSHWMDVLVDIGKRLADKSERRRAMQFIRSRHSGDKGAPGLGKDALRRPGALHPTGALDIRAFFDEMRQTRTRDD